MRTFVNLCLVVSVVIASSNVATAALVDHYEFEGNGVDSQGANANGSVGGNVTFPSAEIGLGAEFGTSGVGAANRITVPQANAFNPGSGDFSYAFFVKRAGNDSNEDGVFDALNGTGVGYQSLFSSSNQLALRLDTSTNNQVFTSTGTITDTTDFHHVAVVVDRSSDVKFYFDGVLDSTVNIVSVTGSVAPNQDLWIGGFNNNHGLDGILDDLRFYNHALTAEEVAQLQPAAPTAPEPSALILVLAGCLMVSARRRVGRTR